MKLLAAETNLEDLESPAMTWKVLELWVHSLRLRILPLFESNTENMLMWNISEYL